MYRLLFSLTLASALLPAQDAPTPLSLAPPSLTALRQSAEQKTQTWETMAKALEPKIRGLLPCDPKIEAEVEEVSRASDARLAALGAYFGAVLKETSARAAQANRLLDSRTKIGSEFLETEHAEGIEERAGTEFQISSLAANAVRKPELNPADAALRDVAAMVEKRNLLMVQQSTRADSLSNSLRALGAQSQAAEAAMTALANAHTNEAIQWRLYYAARLARVGAECTAINPTPRPQSR
jgi:hypothetical protein